MSLPKVRKTLKSRLSRGEKLGTGALVAAALVTAGMGAPGAASASTDPQVTEPRANTVVLTPASTGTRALILAQWHASHASHASHYSHYSGR
jgi:hypothetical protein